MYRTVEKNKAKILFLGVSVIKQIEMKGRRFLSQYTFGNLLFFEIGYLSVHKGVCLLESVSIPDMGWNFLLSSASGSLVVVYQRKT